MIIVLQVITFLKHEPTLADHIQNSNVPVAGQQKRVNCGFQRYKDPGVQGTDRTISLSKDSRIIVRPRPLSILYCGVVLLVVVVVVVHGCSPCHENIILRDHSR